MTRVVRALAAVALVALATPVTSAGATTYRYWVYWHYTSGAWHYSGVGPSGYRVPDGGVEGWRFGRGESSSSVASPRLGSEYDQLCPNEPASAAGTQVAVVIDYGTEADSPGYAYSPAHCLTLSGSRQGSDALVTAAKPDGIRVENGLVCAIRDYPKAPECGKTVSDPKPKPTTPRPAATTAPPPQQQPSRPAAHVSAVTVTRTPTISTVPQPTRSAAGVTAILSTSASPSAVSNTSADDHSSRDPAVPRGTPFGLIAGAVLVLALGAAAAVKARR